MAQKQGSLARDKWRLTIRYALGLSWSAASFLILWPAISISGAAEAQDAASNGWRPIIQTRQTTQAPGLSQGSHDPLSLSSLEEQGPDTTGDLEYLSDMLSNPSQGTPAEDTPAEDSPAEDSPAESTPTEDAYCLDTTEQACGEERCFSVPSCQDGCGYDPCWRQCSDAITARGDYLLWWTRGMRVPPLVTTGPPAGILGQPNTTILYGNSTLTDRARSGGRFVLDFWTQPNMASGFELSYFDLGKQTSTFRASSTGDPILARPIFDIVAGVEASRLIASPNLVDGSIAVDATTEMYGVEALLRRVLTRYDSTRIDWTLGWRFNRLDDDLSIRENTIVRGGGVFPNGTTFDLFDRFDTRNEFHGAQLGLIMEERCARWSWETVIKLAMGNTHSRVVIDGATTTTVPSVAPVDTVGGLLALPTNMGVYRENHFSVMPEFGVTLKCDLTNRLQATFGYSFIYWSKVLRPGDQIDRDINQTQLGGGVLAGAARPEFSPVTTDFWAQGMNFGLEYRY